MDTAAPHMVYLLADQRAGPNVIGFGGLLADVMREIKHMHFKRTCAADGIHLAAFFLIWFERMQTHSAALPRARRDPALAPPLAAPLDRVGESRLVGTVADGIGISPRVLAGHCRDGPAA